MRSSYILGILAGILTYFFMWLDQKLFDSPKTRATYFKNVLFVSLLVGVGVRLLGEERFEDMFTFGGSPKVGAGYVDYRGYDDMLTGTPDF